MELTQHSISNIGQFNSLLQNKQNETLALAQKNVKDIVETEMSLLNFEIMLGVNMNTKERNNLTRKSKSLRTSTHKNLLKLSNNNFEKMNQMLNNF